MRLSAIVYGVRANSADPSIVGKQLSFNDTPHTILGVMPAGFHYPDDIDVWERLRWDMTQHSRQGLRAE